MRRIGTLVKWDDDRGFGFLSPNQSNDEIFVHISAFPKDGKRPLPGETLSFETEQQEGKTRAVKIQRPSGNSKASDRQKSREARARKPGFSLLEAAVALVLVVGAGYFGYSRFQAKPVTQGIAIKQETSIPVQESSRSQARFSCDGREHCSQMNSYEEAKFFIANCPNTKMDGDGDGKPCEDQFNKH